MALYVNGKVSTTNAVLDLGYGGRGAEGGEGYLCGKMGEGSYSVLHRLSLIYPLALLSSLLHIHPVCKFLSSRFLNMQIK